MSDRRDRDGVAEFFIDPGRWAANPAVGDSVAVGGCCLTVAGITDRQLLFQAVPETLRTTTLGALEVGRRVNLEGSATPATLLGGHIVLGHVDGVAEVVRVMREGEHRVRLHAGRDLMQYVSPKGSVAIDGVSLTVAEVNPEEGWFEVALIPTTLTATTLGELEPGSLVNLECDALVKAVVHWIRHYGGGG